MTMIPNARPFGRLAMCLVCLAIAPNSRSDSDSKLFLCATEFFWGYSTTVEKVLPDVMLAPNRDVSAN